MIDVLHTMYFGGMRSAIEKVATNIVTNGKGLNQELFPIPHYVIERPVNGILKRTAHTEEEALLKKIEELRPRIVHCHFNSMFDLSLFSKLSYKPIFVQTVHGNVRSYMGDLASFIVCIHQPCYEKNRDFKNVRVIENTVDVSGVPKHEPNDGPFCATLRFSPEKITSGTFETFGQLKKTTDVYGFIGSAEYSQELLRLSEKYPNVRCFPWDRNAEHRLHSHYAFLNYIPNNDPDVCFGLSAMEAVCIGMPVISIPRKQEYQTYIKPKWYNGIVCLEEEFSKRANLLVEDKAFYLEMCANAKEVASTIHNMMPNQYMKIYEKLLS